VFAVLNSFRNKVLNEKILLSVFARVGSAGVHRMGLGVGSSRISKITIETTRALNSVHGQIVFYAYEDNRLVRIAFWKHLKGMLLGFL
jgi:hypothetical protein